MLMNHTAYNDNGELMAPRSIDIRHKQLRAPGGTPTTEAGFYHRFKFESPNQYELDAKTRRFFDMMNQVAGYSTLSLRPYEVRIGALYRTGLEVIYVVEAQRPVVAQRRR